MMSRAELSFYKMQGAGNDFVILPLGKNTKSVSKLDWETLAKKICDRHYGVGADGLVGLELLHSSKLRWYFYNSDGSRAEMCGNAARCAVSLMFQLGKTERRVQLQTEAGLIDGEMQPDRTVKLILPSNKKVDPKPMKVAGHHGYFINTGVPHFIVPVDVIDLRAWRPESAKLRSHPEFGKNGSNVTLVKALSERSATAVTYERGVEDFTLSCGTGALAAGAWMLSKKNIPEAQIEMPGGDFFVGMTPENKMFLRGDAKIVFHGKLNPGAINGIF